jgi:hypothetical protein
MRSRSLAWQLQQQHQQQHQQQQQQQQQMVARHAPLKAAAAAAASSRVCRGVGLSRSLLKPLLSLALQMMLTQQ